MEYKIYVGSFLNLKKGFFKGKIKLMYCGMCNDTTFVLAPCFTTGYQGFSPNVYYPADARFIHIKDIELEVLELTTEYIVLGD